MYEILKQLQIAEAQAIDECLIYWKMNCLMF